MKIVILSDDFPPLINGGAAAAAGTMATQLKSLGCDVSVITTCRQLDQAGSVVTVSGIMVYSICSNYHERWRAWLSLYNPQTVFKVKQLLKDLNPDIVHAHNIHYHLSYYCLVLAKKFDAKVFLSAHDVMIFHYGKLKSSQINTPISWWDQFLVYRLRFNPWRNLFIRYCLRSVDKIFAVSPMLKKVLQLNNISRPIDVVANGIDLQEWSIESTLSRKMLDQFDLVDKDIILFVGQPTVAKGIKQLLSAFKEISSYQPQARLLVVGRSSKITEKLIIDLGLGLIRDRIVILDWIDRDLLPVIYHLARIIVMPSICFDTFGLVAAEALACGRPVVVSCFAGISDLVERTGAGSVVNPLKKTELVKAILNFLINKNEAERIGQLGQSVVEKYLSVNQTTALVLAEYKRVISFQI
ncbi:MAG: glycosyltransferase family 4 protein [Candidatus Vogelbacteria bacterium]|nr:glycosyltransferase family 4 protein [Candidatus Vogelbacteria bacterium]